jgi:multisubunit Na+/H+ antiporter MnhE subunit
MLKVFRCTRERIVLGINLAILSLWLVYNYIPFQLEVTRQLRIVSLAMWILAAILSASMLISNIGASHHNGGSRGNQK